MNSVIVAIENRDVAAVVARVFEKTSDSSPHIRSGFRRETELWDFKRGLPSLRKEHASAWADIAADIAAFHNNKGGVLFFGIEDRSIEFVGTRDILDAKRFNDQIRRYVGDQIWVEFSREFVQADQRYLGVALIPPKTFVPIRMQADAAPKNDGTQIFMRGDLCIRDGDQTNILHGSAADTYVAKNRLPSPDARFLVNDATARILRPDWTYFIVRDELCPKVVSGLRDDRTYVTTLSGIGGIGKTALASWAVLEAYKEKQFEYIASVTAKDRELTGRGIRPIDATLSSFDDLLNEILELLGFSEYVTHPTDVREATVRDLLPGTRILLFVDNLETVEDARVVQFLETLPKPVKAITTSRTASVRTAAFPITVGPLSASEAAKFFDHYATVQGKVALKNASPTEKQRIVDACSAVPLALQWLIGHAGDLASALSLAEAMVRSGSRQDELLEFCFRRVHIGLPQPAKDVLAALTLDDRPQPVEAIAVACDYRLDEVDKALEDLQDCSLVERVWDEKLCDTALRCLPITRRFAYKQLQQQSGLEFQMRARLSDWYEGKDVHDPVRRNLVVAARQGRKDPDVVLVDAAIAFRRQGRIDEAEKYFSQALARNPRSWRANREYAELLRDQEKIGAALDHYERAADNAPARGEDRARIFREWGMLLRTSGKPTAWREAAEKFEIARVETPNDPLVLHALAKCYVQLNSYKKAQPILERLITFQSPETRARSYDLLMTCYERMNETTQLEILRHRIEDDEEARNASPASRRTVVGSSKPLTSGTSVSSRRGDRR